MNSLVVIAFLGLAAYTSATVISYAGAPIAVGTTDLTGAIGIAQGQRDAYLGRVAAAQAQAANIASRVAVAGPNGITVTDLNGAIGIAQGNRDAYLGRVAAAQAQINNIAHRGIVPIGAAGIPLAHAGIIGGQIII